LRLIALTLALEVVLLPLVGFGTTNVLEVLALRLGLISLVGSRSAGVLEVELLGLSLIVRFTVVTV
jgi:hypothetical protein